MLRFRDSPGLSLAVRLSCDTLHVIYPATDQLSSAERAFMINAIEIPPITFFVAPQWGSRPLELA